MPWQLARSDGSRNDFLPQVRTRLHKELGIPPLHVVINASHCHGVVRPDTAELTVQAVQQATERLAPVTVGVGVGSEIRVMENRRLKLRSGRTVDVRKPTRCRQTNRSLGLAR